MRTRAALLAILLGGGGACGREAPDRTPEGALEAFLDAMARSHWEEAALEDAYALLSPEARANLERRATLASALAGRRVEPWSMIVQGRFHQRFEPRRGRGFVSKVDGDTAIVTVRGRGEDERARMSMVREGDRWRVALHLPE